MTTITGEIKVIINYGDGVNPNWFIVINDAEGQEHKVYSGDNWAEFTKDDIVQVEGTTHTGKKGAYIKADKFIRINESTNQDATQPVEKKPQKNVQDYTRVPDKSGLSREEAILLTGIFTRGVTSTKSADDLDAYANRALQYFRNKVAHKVAQTPQNNVNKGVNNEPFNNQF